ncbi:hypothetical protein NDU88_000804 [Pleurodeles waltl]|uniref:Uncharacterized protein n=1 Tax=Pleurodeles waltl TaxID=8319 RepID=A0AAV7TGK1_PLEWA|nr:hypothetical protein NDU88_000804 [Pleurodeles waltl]
MGEDALLQIAVGMKEPQHPCGLFSSRQNVRIPARLHARTIILMSTANKSSERRCEACRSVTNRVFQRASGSRSCAHKHIKTNESSEQRLCRSVPHYRQWMQNLQAAIPRRR